MNFLPVLALVLVAIPVPAAEEPPDAAVTDLAWMAGHWRQEREDSVVEEGWLGPSGGTMLGVNRTVASGRTVAFEYLRLEESGSGVVLLASPDGRCPATPFILVELDGRRAVFANPEHDFPQRIVYRRDGDSLHASIEGVVGGESRTAGWQFELQP